MNALILNKLDTVKFWIENDILFCKFNQLDYYFSEDEARFFLTKIEKLTKGNPMPCVIDARQFVGNFSPSAAKLFTASPIIENILVHAFIADTFNVKLLIGSFIRIFGQKAHMQIFNTPETALEYCIIAKNLRDA
ncbi:hypothetical protein BZARG_587 [Bizionia argentinensis JUB59]|uniref:DUF7793 domain-containing protein n=1 Tax=Bizionia argentinensis JUB59 TaxID=1046627 RepID=G2EHJ9_9FLAO|nr:hypothetical protein [Bizionia argentinensis]EGV42245.1 hypothetical protein BZARG_587 [Bizionia argentinensis JUB59]